jgi:phosphate transport system substrate-binding protein
MSFRIIKHEKALATSSSTLVLVAIAIIGAAAIGLMLGSYCNNMTTHFTDIGSKVSASEASAAAIRIGGSTTCQPVVTDLAAQYMEDRKGINITVQGGGSGVGRDDVISGALDIGMSSDDIDPIQYPYLIPFAFGGSAVIPVVNNISDVNFTTADDLRALYQYANSSGVVGAKINNGKLQYDSSASFYLTVLQRSDKSGTEETFSKYIGLNDKTWINNTKAMNEVGNSGMLTAIQNGTTPTLGFLDVGYAFDSTGKNAKGVTIIGIDSCPATSVTHAEVLKTLKAGNTQTFPLILTRQLYFCTLGPANTYEQDFMNYCVSPQASGTFTKHGVYSIITIKEDTTAPT